MSYEDIVRAGLGGTARPLVSPEMKILEDRWGTRFPVLLCREREHRPFRHYRPYSRADCPLCRRVQEGSTCPEVVPGMAWLPATYPIKSLHAIVYPTEHRASILPQDVAVLGGFVDRAGDAVACINLRGSAASLPEHIHAQIHDQSLPRSAPAARAFPLLSCEPEWLTRERGMALGRITSYPAFALVVEGDWPRLGHWLVTYLAASNSRPHNFALCPRGRFVVIPRGLEKAPTQENRYGASEMLGLITPVTSPAYEALDCGETVAEALSACGLQDPKERLALEEHALWVLRHVQRCSGEAPRRPASLRRPRKEPHDRR